ncbi:MAG: glycosyltransferase family 4 protein [Candidatus Bathyarchaeia archaeon]
MTNGDQMKICLVTSHSYIDRSWVRQDIEILKALGFEVMALSTPCDFPDPRFLIWLIKHLKSILNCHVIYEWFAFPPIVFIGKAFGKPTVLNAVGYEIAYYPEFSYGEPCSLFKRAIISLGLRNADYVIAISRESAKWAYTWGARNVTIIYEGIDTGKFVYKSNRLQDRHMIVTVAYLGLMNIIRKGLITLLEAMKHVIAVLPDAKLIIVGEKMDGYQVLVEKATKLGVIDAVDFKGLVDFEELLRIMHGSSVFVMPSLQEGFPTALCEALSCGVPIITTNRPAMDEVFENNVHALLVEAKNSQKLAEAITVILTNRKLAEAIARNGRKLVESKYSKNVRAKNLREYFLTLLKKEKKQGKHRGFNIVWLGAFGILSVIYPLAIMLKRSLQAIQLKAGRTRV